MDSKLRRKNFILCCVAIFFVGSFVFGLPGVMSSYWQETFGVGKEDVGRLMFFLLIGTGCSMYLTGKLQEKIKYHYLIFYGNLACSILMFCVGFAGSMIMVYIWAFFTGFFCGFVYIPVLTVVQRLYPENRGTSTGMVNMLFGGAAAIVSPVLTMMLISFGAVFMTSIAALLCLVISTTSSFIIRIPDLPEQKGNNTVAAEDRASILSFKETLKLRSFWLLWGVWAMAGAAGISMITLSASYGSYLGFSLDKYVWLLIGFSITNGLSRIVSGRLADFLSHQKILMVCFIVSGLAYLLLIFSSNLIVVSFLAAAVGIAFGSMFAVSAPLVSHCFGIINFGRIFGLVFTAYGFVAGFLGPWLSGFLLDMNFGGYTFVFLYLAIFYFISSLFIIKIKPVDFS